MYWSLTTFQPFWVILYRLPEKGEKEIEEKVEEMKERKKEGKEREETEEIKTFPLTATRIASLAQQ